MPIGDLLAEISGEKPSPALATSQLNLQAKRKADDNPPAPPPKALRTVTGIFTSSSNNNKSSTSSPSQPVSASMSHAADKKILVARHRPAADSMSVRPSPLLLHKPRPAVTGVRMDNRSPVVQGRSVPPPAPVSSGAVPKKGSFAEIMARAKQAQAAMGPLAGRIQHKPMERVKKTTDDGRGETGNKKMGGGGGSGSGASSSSLRRAGSTPPSKTMRNGTGSNNGTAKKDSRNGVRTGEDSKGRKPVDVKPEKKIKKAALATTGYTGTARPKPGAMSGKLTGSGSRAATGAGVGVDAGRGAAGVVAGRPRPPRPYQRPGSRRYEDEVDEELDDFIEYDDEEDEGPAGKSRYDYDSDGSSDMEAGLEDIDQEEWRSGRIAKEEDVEQERILELRKQEKKRRAMEELRRRRGR